MKKVQIKCGGDVLFPACYLADNFFFKGRGLLFRDQEFSRAGLFFWSNNSIHMIGMKYPITCVMLDKHMVVRQVAVVQPGFHFLTDFKAKHTLECHEEQYERLSLTIGRSLSMSYNIEI